MSFFIGLFHILCDLALAGFDLVTRRRRRCYAHTVTIEAPIETIRAALQAEESVYAMAGLRTVERPAPERGPNRYFADIYHHDDLIHTAEIEKIPTGDENLFAFSYVGDDRSGAHYGDDDVVTIRLDSLGPARTRAQYQRELTHRSASTRLTAPFGLRQAAWLEKMQAEHGLLGPEHILGKLGQPTDDRPRRRRPAETTGEKVRTQVVWAILALLSFAFIAGWQDAVILLILVALHELGHAAAMLAVGSGVGFVRFVPFFGGMAAPRRPYKSEWQLAIVALAGPGLSLVPTALLLWFALATDNLLAANAAVLFALVNGINLLPIVPLDGGVVLRSLLGSIHPLLGRIVSWIGAVILAAAAVYFKSILLGIVFAFAMIQLFYQSSYDPAARRRRLHWLEGTLILVLFVITLGLYVWLTAYAFPLREALERFAAGPAQAVERTPAPPDGPPVPRQPRYCRLPLTPAGIADLALRQPDGALRNGGDFLRFVTLARAAGDSAVVEQWLSELPASDAVELAGLGSLVPAMLREWLTLLASGTADEIARFLDAHLASTAADTAAHDALRRQKAWIVGDVLIMDGRFDVASTFLAQTSGDRGLPAYFRGLVQAGELDRAQEVFAPALLATSEPAVGQLVERLLRDGRREDAITFTDRIVAAAAQLPEPRRNQALARFAV